MPPSNARGPDASDEPHADAARIDQRAWRAQYRDPQEATALGEQLLASDDTTWQAWGAFHVAFSALRSGRTEVGRAAADRLAARCADTPASDAALAAAWRDLQALQSRHAGRHADALAWLEPNLALGADVRSSASRYVSLNLAGLSCISLGLQDRSLHLHYQARAVAQDSGDGALLANACANLGGVQTDLLNLEEGRQLSAQAVAVADDAGLQGSALWLTAQFNLAHACLLSGDAAGAQAAASRMQAFEHGIPAAKRARYEVLFGAAAMQSGRWDDAARWLDQARSRWSSDDEAIIEWTVAQATLDNLHGRHVDARARCDAHRHRTRSGSEDVLPLDLMQLFEQGVKACEALGDHRAALDYKHQVFELYEGLAGRSARASRVTAEIHYALDLAQRARDDAQRRRLDAEEEQRRLTALNQALEEANATRTRFLAAASHDLRQPLHTLRLQASVLHDRLRGSPLGHDVERMEQSIRALSDMFDALLDLSRMEAQAIVPHWQPVLLQPLLVRLTEEHMPEAERRGLRLRLRWPDAARSLSLRTDPALLETLLRNLIGNGLKYTERGGVMLGLRRRHGTPEGWRIEIIDTGVGIAPDELPRIFEAFYQLSNPARLRARGLGLGLAIVRGLADLLQLRLECRSRVGRGSRFGVAFDASAVPAPRPPARPHASPIGALRVAVVEDDDRAREALVQRLQAWGCEVQSFGDAASLLTRLDLTPPAAAPQALITDLRLPGSMDGRALARAWRGRLGPHRPALLLTGDLGGTPDPSELPWLPKPVDTQALHAWLKQAARRADRAAAQDSPER